MVEGQKTCGFVIIPIEGLRNTFAYILIGAVGGENVGLHRVAFRQLLHPLGAVYRLVLETLEFPFPDKSFFCHLLVGTRGHYGYCGECHRQDKKRFFHFFDF